MKCYIATDDRRSVFVSDVPRFMDLMPGSVHIKCPSREHARRLRDLMNEIIGKAGGSVVVRIL